MLVPCRECGFLSAKRGGTANLFVPGSILLCSILPGLFVFQRPFLCKIQILRRRFYGCLSVNGAGCKRGTQFRLGACLQRVKNRYGSRRGTAEIQNVSSHCYMLESCEDRENHGRYTFVGYDPKLEISCRNYEVKITDAFGVRRFSSSPQKYIRQILEDYRSQKMMRFPILRAGW